MVEAPPSKNHKTRIPFWHPRNNKPPCGSLVTTLLTSLRHAGGEADAISLLCFALIVYQTISDLSTGKSRNFFFFVNSFPRGGNTIFCTQTVLPWGQERRHVPCRRKTARAIRRMLRRSPVSRRTKKTTASDRSAGPEYSGLAGTGARLDRAHNFVKFIQKHLEGNRNVHECASCLWTLSRYFKDSDHS